MTFKEIQELLKLVNKSNITEFKIEQENFKLTIRTKKYGKVKSSAVAPQQQIVPIQTTPLPTISPSYVPPTQVPSAAPADNPTPTPENQEAAEASTEYIEVRSPIVGTFYRAPSPEKPPYVKVGDKIEVGSVVCIVEAMKLFNEIESEVSGTIVKVMVDDAHPVEYDQVLYLVDPNG